MYKLLVLIGAGLAILLIPQYSFGQDLSCLEQIPETLSEVEIINAIKECNNLNENEECLGCDPFDKPGQEWVNANVCEGWHILYVLVPEDQYLALLSQFPLSRDCLLLYKDPIWEYQGKDRIEQLVKRFGQLKQAEINEQKINQESIEIEEISGIGGIFASVEKQISDKVTSFFDYIMRLKNMFSFIP